MAETLRALSWDVDGRDWPNRRASRFVEAAGLRWHVQVMGQGPLLLLVHGTGASTHSWRDLAPLLAGHFQVVACDLPGHGFTTTPEPARLSMPGMAEALDRLLQQLGLAPEWAVGHSAGVAVLARMCLDGRLAPRLLVSLNGALLPLGGMRNPAFASFARVFATGNWLPRLFAQRAAADPAVVERMLAQTGSRLDAEGLALYRLLAANPAHSRAALAMMSMWDPRPLERDLPRLRVPLALLAGSEDRMILPGEAARVRTLVPGARVHLLRGLGHLAHEERPAEIAGLIQQLRAEVEDGFPS